MTLPAAYMEIVGDWRPVFCQPRSHLRAVRQALGGLLCLGRRTLTRIIWTDGGQRRRVRYKEVGSVYWQGGARRRPLRLLRDAG